MNFAENTGRTIQEAFEEFHRLNPSVYNECKKLALDAIQKGRKKISFKLIINVIRWEKYLQTEEPTLWNQDGKQVAFKINDAYSSRYARLFRSEFPQYADRIEFRDLRSK
jgi:hypothetical protein